MERVCSICNKSRKTNLTEKPFVCRWCKAQTKRKETWLRNYGVDNPLKAKSTQERIKQTNLEKYGFENVAKSEKIKQKKQITCLQKYESTSPLGSKAIQEKIKKSCLKHFGVENPNQANEIKQKKKQTCLKRYGVENYGQTQEMQKQRRAKYSIDDQKFDSYPEYCFYRYCVDNNIQVRKYSGQGFEYFFKEKKHFYYPDFEVIENDKVLLIELKGDQFLTENNTWQNPFDHSKDDIYEAKRQCAIKNNVKILYSKDYQKYIDYVKHCKEA